MHSSYNIIRKPNRLILDKFIYLKRVITQKSVATLKSAFQRQRRRSNAKNSVSTPKKGVQTHFERRYYAFFHYYAFSKACKRILKALLFFLALLRLLKGVQTHFERRYSAFFALLCLLKGVQTLFKGVITLFLALLRLLKGVITLCLHYYAF